MESNVDIPVFAGPPKLENNLFRRNTLETSSPSVRKQFTAVLSPEAAVLPRAADGGLAEAAFGVATAGFWARQINLPRFCL